MSERKRLDPRHPSLTTKVVWANGYGAEQHFIVTFGIDDKHQIREAFCASFKRDSDMVALANDACILLSRLLQMQISMEDIANSLGENAGQPASIIGTITKAGLEMQQWLTSQS